MNANIGLMKEKMERLKAKRETLRVEAKGLARDIPVKINPTLTTVEEMDVAGAASLMDELVVKQAELLSLRSKIWELEEALGY